MKDIYQMAAEFRTAMLKAKANREFSGDGLIEFFPRGNCGIVCDLLGRYLLEQAGVRSWYTSGEVSSESHVWLTLENDDIVDITGDQYKDRSGSLYYDLPVYVGKMDAFHSRFRLNGDPAEITPNDRTPDFLGEDRIQRKKRIAYETILKYIG
ncbi:MAG: hypothetical protein PUE78_04025 [Clostridia bacterium]|nr:hypothetical protein [Clostridia bacterium]